MKFLKGKGFCDVLLMVNGGTRTWTAKCYLGSREVKLRWRKFVKDNGLCEGDACVFELRNDIKPCLNIIIFRSSKDEEVKGNLRNTDLGEISSEPTTCKRKKLKEVDNVSNETLMEDDDYGVSGHLMNGISRKIESENLEKTKTWHKRKQTVSFIHPALERAKAIRSTRPSFVSFMHCTYISAHLNINKKFALQFIKVKSLCDVVLQVPGGTRTWTAKCYLGKYYAKLNWSTFVKDNRLCEGDACVFELENDTAPSLNVIIFRSSEDEHDKGNLRKTNHGEIWSIRKNSERKKLEEIVDTDISKEILMKIPSLKDISRKPKTCKRRKLEEVDDDVSIEISEKDEYDESKEEESGHGKGDEEDIDKKETTAKETKT